MSEFKNKRARSYTKSSGPSGSLESMVTHDLSSDLITNHNVPSFADFDSHTDEKASQRVSDQESNMSSHDSLQIAGESSKQNSDPQQELAAVLLGARQNLGLSIESLAERSLVHSRFIQGLEQARDLEVAQTYLRGYLKLLAEQLGLDAQRLLELHTRACALKEQQLMSVEQKSSATDAATAQTGFLDQLSTVSTEALGAVAVACAQVKQLFKASSSSESGHKKPGATRRQPVKEHAAERPKALVREGTAWHSPSLLRVSNGLPWRAVAVSMMCLAFIAGIYVDVDVADKSGGTPQLVDESDRVNPGAELAIKALGVDAGVAEARDSAGRLVPLNQQERRAALAGLDQSTESSGAMLEQSPEIANSEAAVETPDSSRLVAIESTVSEGDSLILEAGTENASVRSVINVGEFRGGGRVVANTGSLSDSYEPIGPGAEYMISQHAMQDRLVISVYEDSWVDVRDAKGVRLYRNLAKAGRRIDLSGELPFSLHVGNAPGLALELNGDYVPIERYRSDNSARLTLVDTPSGL